MHLDSAAGLLEEREAVMRFVARVPASGASWIAAAEWFVEE